MSGLLISNSLEFEEVAARLEKQLIRMLISVLSSETQSSTSHSASSKPSRTKKTSLDTLFRGAAIILSNNPSMPQLSLGERSSPRNPSRHFHTGSLAAAN